jgi:hypothetical protein
MLWPVNCSLAYVGYSVLAPFVAYGLEADRLRYSEPAVVEERLSTIVDDFCAAVLPRVGERAGRYPSIAKTNGQRTAGLCRVHQSTRRSCVGRNILSWSEGAGSWHRSPACGGLRVDQGA